jgi:hypothetical protein
MRAPEAVVKDFIADYCQWNDRWYARCKGNEHSLKLLAESQAEYADLLSRYCRPGFKGQPAASFGTPSDHRPDTEIIKEIILNGSHAVVRTTETDPIGIKSDYEYSLTFDDGRWFLEAVEYIDEEGRFSTL